MTGRPDLALPELERAAEIFRSLGDETEVAHLMHRIANAALQMQDVDRAVRVAREALDLDRRHGRRRDEGIALSILAWAAFLRGDREEGTRLGYESAAIADSVGFIWWKGVTLMTMAEHLLAADDVDTAFHAFAEGLEALAFADDRVNLPLALAVGAALAARKAEPTHAGLLWGAVEAASENEPRPTTTAALMELEPHLKRLSGPTFEQARERGRSLSIEDAVAYARRELH
jgi:tetratricopeptide (TPR) repeat protein